MKAEDPVFDTEREILLRIWSELQMLQTEFAYRQELSLFYQCRAWLSAENVLDAGCGNGHYITVLSRFFRDKSYTGMDLSPELIEAAKKECRSGSFNFTVADFLDSSGSYDAIIMRLFLQHLQEPEKAIDNARRLLKPGGVLIIIDSVDGYRHYYPPVPLFCSLFSEYRATQGDQGRNRDITSQIPEIISSDHSWDICHNRDIVISSTLQGNDRLFLKIYTLFVDMIDVVGEIDCPFDLVRKEIEEWSKSGGYTQIGLKMLALVRR